MADRPIWEQLEGESNKAYQAFLAYRDMPDNERSIEKVARKFSKSVGLLNRWSGLWNWVSRVTAYKQHLESVAQEAKEAEIKEIMSHQYANIHERVKVLNELANELRELTKDREAVWVKDYRMVGRGEDAQLMEVEKFNVALFDQLRGTLGDIAAETGGRTKKQDINIRFPKPSKPIEEMNEAELAEYERQLRSSIS